MATITMELEDFFLILIAMFVVSLSILSTKFAVEIFSYIKRGVYYAKKTIESISAMRNRAREHVE